MKYVDILLPSKKSSGRKCQVTFCTLQGSIPCICFYCVSEMFAKRPTSVFAVLTVCVTLAKVTRFFCGDKITSTFARQLADIMFSYRPNIMLDKCFHSSQFSNFLLLPFIHTTWLVYNWNVQDIVKLRCLNNSHFTTIFQFKCQRIYLWEYQSPMWEVFIILSTWPKFSTLSYKMSRIISFGCFQLNDTHLKSFGFLVG